jgi:hypothetical protein
MRVVKDEGYDPRAFDTKMAAAAGGRKVQYAKNLYSPASVAPESVPQQEASIARARWYWREDSHNIDKHNPRDVLDGQFVSYAGSVGMELDRKYDAFVSGGERIFEIDLNDRIGSTGTEQKAHNAHTGAVFNIDLSAMAQINVKSGFRRDIKRVVVSEKVEAPVPVRAVAPVQTEAQADPQTDAMLAKVKKELGLEGTLSEVATQACGMLGVTIGSENTPAMKIALAHQSLFGNAAPATPGPLDGWTNVLGGSLGGLFSGGGGEGAKHTSTISKAAQARVLTDAFKLKMQRALGAKGNLPTDLQGEDSLICYPGQLLQTSKTRPDGWAFGSVCYDPAGADRPPLGIDGISLSTGWFPLAATDLPTADQMAELQKMMGGGDGAADALKAPDTWTRVKDPMLPEMVPVGLGTPEAQAVKAAFMKTLTPNVKIRSIERIQNTSMWQSYAVKRQTIVMRDKDAKSGNQSRLERIWLFHGTDGDTVPKIVGMGFNRSFCGKNATRCKEVAADSNAAGPRHVRT